MKPRRPDVTTRMSLALLSRLFDLAYFVSRGTPRNTHPLASGGLSGAVALEVAARTSGNLGRTAPAHPTHGRPRMRSGARSASLTSCCSSSGLGSRRGRSGSTCSKRPPGRPRGDQRWSTFLRNHARALIPMSEAHLRAILKEWRAHYNRSRPHMALGPGFPDPPPTFGPASKQNSRYRLGERLKMRARSVLGGLHHDYLFVETRA